MSLLEALVALSIVGLIGTLAYPRLEQASQAAVLRQAATVLVQDLRRARAQAVRSGSVMAVAAAAGGRGYLLPDHSLRPLPEGVSLGQGTAVAAIRFFPDGAASGGGMVVVSHNRALAVAVDSVTGSIALGPP